MLAAITQRRLDTKIKTKLIKNIFLFLLQQSVNLVISARDEVCKEQRRDADIMVNVWERNVYIN